MDSPLIVLIKGHKKPDEVGWSFS